MMKVHLAIEVWVLDPEALVEYAKWLYAQAWSDPDWEPDDIGEAVLEALVVSNLNPSPDAYGIEIGSRSATVVDDPRRQQP